LPTICTRLSACGVELRGDEIARSVVPGMKPADETDWPAEYQDLILAIKVVPSLDAAIEHINRYGSRHSDAIITKSAAAWRRFARDVDSAAIYWNASTRFTDGGEFGFGAEIGISTDKLHARGPMGLEELTTYKYVVTGTGQVRS
jgi:glutamate-5-semialdehyde dehydrogenase